MDRKKIIYIGLILIVTVIVSVTYFSYAFFVGKSEQRGKINIVTGDLTYRLKSADLTNNQMTIEANTSKKVDIQLTSLNDIDSKYELYYETTNNNVSVKYSEVADNPKGSITKNGTKNIVLNVKNTGNTDAVVTFKIAGGFSYNDLTLTNVSTITKLSKVTVTFDENRGNLMENASLGETSANSVQKNGDVYTITGQSTRGARIPDGVLEYGKEYILTYKIKKLSGTLLNIGGHASAASNPSFKLDGVNAGTYFFSIATGAPLVTNLSDDTNVHTIEFRFKYLPAGTGDEYLICIQPNRGRSDAVTVELTDLTLTEVPDTTLEYYYGQAYGNITAPTKSGYTFKGWNGKNLLDFETSNHTNSVTFNGNKIIYDSSQTEGNNAWNINIQAYDNNTFVRTLSNGGNEGRIVYSFTPLDFNGISVRLNTSKLDQPLIFSNILSINSSYILSFNIDEFIVSSAYAVISNLQLELGNMTTDYEPYYITSTTPVTESETNTLTAIWEPVN